MLVVVEGICCPVCSTLDCVVTLTDRPSECPTCGCESLVDSVEFVAKLQLQRQVAEDVGLEVIEPVPGGK